MPENKNQLVFGFLVLGLILIGLSAYFAYFAGKPDKQEVRLARIHRETGKVFALRAGLTQKEQITQRESLFNLDSVETLETGEAVISFESAYRVRLFANTLVTLERINEHQDFHVVLILKRGDIRIENYGREGELFIAKNGDRISASDYNASPLAQEPVEPVKPSEAYSTPIPADQGLSEEEISTIMSNNRGSFFRCYTQLLQTDPSAKGNVSLSFTIENNGKLSVAEVTASQLGGDEFKKCLMEVLRRIEFRSFKGPAISTLFPLKFE